MKLDSKESEAMERLRKVVNGIVIIVKEKGHIRQVTISIEKQFQLLDKNKEKK